MAGDAISPLPSPDERHGDLLGASLVRPVEVVSSLLVGLVLIAAIPGNSTAFL